MVRKGSIMQGLFKIGDRLILSMCMKMKFVLHYMIINLPIMASLQIIAVNLSAE